MANPTHSKSIDKVRLPIPEIIDPPKRRCVTIEIPDDRMHFAAFWGHFFGMTRWYTWKLDAAKSGKALAAVYQKIYDDARARFVLGEDSCMGCAHVNPPMSPPLAAGEVRTFHTTVEAGEFNLLPIVLLANQSITLSDFRGQWRDSTYHPVRPCTSNWETATGIVIDATGGTPADNAATDILPDVPHMKLIMRVNNCGILTYHDIDDPITFTVPASVSGDGVFVEFLGNMPLDSSGEVAPGFLGYGMVCLTIIASDPNLCPQVFIDFEPPSFPDFTIIEGNIVDPSPIGEGAALQSEAVSTSTMQAQIDIPLPECGVRDFAFTYRVNTPSPVFGATCLWALKDSLGATIASGSSAMPFTPDTNENLTVTVNSPPNGATLNLRWSLSLISFGPQMWIDNVFIN